MARVRGRASSGCDTVPGTTITRYCSSSLQTTRMAFHAIKAGEGTAFISAGVESRVQLRSRQLRPLPGHAEPDLRRGRGAHRGAARRASRRGPTRARTGSARRLHRHGRDRRERRASSTGITRAASRTIGRCGRRTAPRRRSSAAASSPRSRRSRCRTAPWSPPTTARGPARRYEAVSQLKPAFRPDGHGHGRQRLPAQRRRGRASWS